MMPVKQKFCCLTCFRYSLLFCNDILLYMKFSVTYMKMLCLGPKITLLKKKKKNRSTLYRT